MKAKYLHDSQQPNPAYSQDDHLRAMQEGKVYPEPFAFIKPAGTVIEHPDAWMLVAAGAAEAVDKECIQRVQKHREIHRFGKSEADVQEYYDKLSHGRATGDKRYDADE